MAAGTQAASWSMFSGPPLPLPSEFPLLQLIPLIPQRPQVGAWVRGAGAGHRLTIMANGRCATVVIGEDLGQLLCCCTHVVLRSHDRRGCTGRGRADSVARPPGCYRHPIFARSSASGPHLPGARLEPTGFSVPITIRSPEEVLSECVRRGIRVTESRVVYRQQP